MSKHVGNLPVVWGFYNLKCPEFMHVLYMPVVMNGSLRLPHHMTWLAPMVMDIPFEDDDIVYATVKCGFVSRDSGYHNRPGWHIDGFGSDDINYIWYDSVPTEFLDQRMEVSDDHAKSMMQMTMFAESRNICYYGNRLLLRLDNTVVHRVAKYDEDQPRVRTFVKLSVSKNKYNLKGNAHNHLFDYKWEMHDRENKRNDPVKEV